MKPFGACALALVLAGAAAALDVPDKPAARVNDFAHLMDPASAQGLEAKLAGFEQETSNQIVVVTVPSIGDDAIEDAANRLFGRWRLGQKDKNNGVLLLIAAHERRAKIEVGYGLEPQLTDALSRRILEERLFPAFREKDYSGGIAAACDGIIQATRGAYVGNPRARGGPPLPPKLILILVLVVIAIVISIIGGIARGSGLGGGGRRRYWRSGPVIWGGGGGWVGGSSGGYSGWGGGGGGGFGGFSGGGGLSGGGGASGSW